VRPLLASGHSHMKLYMMNASLRGDLSAMLKKTHCFRSISCLSVVVIRLKQQCCAFTVTSLAPLTAISESSVLCY